MINIAEILKDCPKGTKLYSPLCGECRVLNIYDGLGFDVICGYDTVYSFSYDGRYNIMGECCIFPSKENRDWSKFKKPFKDGDILAYTSLYTTVFIYRNKDNEPNRTTSFYVGYTIGGSYCNFHIYNKRTLVALDGNCDTRFATEEEKQKLFAAIKDNGYKWNPETKTLEKLIIPKFKVGDKIVDIYKKHLHCDSASGKISQITDDKYIFDDGSYIHIQCQDNWELVPNKFDITTLVPFESRVLVRYSYNRMWVPTYWGKYLEDKSDCPYLTTKGYYKHCIPYEGNEHLLGTTNDCDEFYKIWE